MKKYICLLGVVTGVFVGSMNAFAASYVQGTMPGYSWIECRGSIGFSGNTMTAVSIGEGQTYGSPLSYKTSITGKLTSNGTVLGTYNGTGGSSAYIKNLAATGYVKGSGSATHNVYYRDQMWSNRTSI